MLMPMESSCRCTSQLAPFWRQSDDDATTRRSAHSVVQASRATKKPRRGFSLDPPSFTRRSMGVGPDLLLGEVHQTGKDDQEDHDLHPHPLAIFEVRFGSPHQECGDVLGVLIEL